MPVSVLIVSWNAREWLARCLRSLAASPCQIIVVDNDSADGSADMVRRDFPAVHLVASPRNLGFAGGVNRARQAATQTALLLLNPDIEVTGRAVDRLAGVLEGEPAIGAVAGRLVDADGKPQAGFNVRRFPPVASLVFDLLLLDHLWPGNPVSRRYYARDLDSDAPADVDQPAAACLLVRTEAFDRLGGLDERFAPAWFEDVDFCLRLREAGYRIRYEPSATFVHRGGVARETLGPLAFSQAYYRNMLRFVRKHHGLAASLIVRTALCAGMVPRAGVALVHLDRPGLAAALATFRDASLGR